MTGKEEKAINECMILLKQDGTNTKEIVYDRLQKLILDHKAKWNK